MTKEQLIQKLSHYSDDTNFIVDIWVANDIDINAEEHFKTKLTKDQRDYVIDNITEDASLGIGISFQSINYYIEKALEVYAND